MDELDHRRHLQKCTFNYTPLDLIIPALLMHQGVYTGLPYTLGV